MKDRKRHLKSAGPSVGLPEPVPAGGQLPGWLRIHLPHFSAGLSARRYELLGLFLYAFILVVRAPWVLFQGRFWAEEGTFFLPYAWTHSFLDSLIAPHAGYYNLVSNLAGIIATRVPLEVAPRFTVALAFLLQLLPAILV